MAISLIKCGLLPVFSSCSMTEITTSSLIPSKSIFLCWMTWPGDGGGVCSICLFGCCDSILSTGGVSRGVGNGDGVLCSRLIRFEGGCSVLWSMDGDALELVRCSRFECGSCMPSEGNDNDLRLVLYGMVLCGG